MWLTTWAVSSLTVLSLYGSLIDTEFQELEKLANTTVAGTLLTERALDSNLAVLVIPTARHRANAACPMCRAASPPPLHDSLTPLRAQVAINTVWSLLCLLWEIQTALIFGALRVEENKVLSECFWQYVLLKVVFLGVILDPSVYEGAVWSAALLVSGFWKLAMVLTQAQSPPTHQITLWWELR